MSTPGGSLAISVATLRRLALVALALGVFLTVALVVSTQRDTITTLVGRGLGEQIDRNAYQAVFLTGGQQYFGKLAYRGDHYLLSDVFYLSAPDQGQTPDPNRPLQLLKRGKELHGPKDPMIIPGNEVVFIENLRDDSDVVVAIKRFNAGDIPSAPAKTVAPSATPRPSPTR